MKEIINTIFSKIPRKIMSIIGLIPKIAKFAGYALRFIIWLLSSWITGHTHWRSSEKGDVDGTPDLDSQTFDDEASEGLRGVENGDNITNQGIVNIINILIKFDRTLQAHDNDVDNKI